MSGQHTPGPWELDGIAIAGSAHRMGDVCLMGEPAQYAGDTADMCENWEANARLIAAAPCLLEALRAAMAFIESHVADPDITDEMIRNYQALQDLRPRDIIAKATGGAA